MDTRHRTLDTVCLLETKLKGQVFDELEEDSIGPAVNRFVCKELQGVPIKEESMLHMIIPFNRFHLVEPTVGSVNTEPPLSVHITCI